MYNERFNELSLCPRKSKQVKYGKEPRYNETSLWGTYFAGPLTPCYIEASLS